MLCILGSLRDGAAAFAPERSGRRQVEVRTVPVESGDRIHALVRELNAREEELAELRKQARLGRCSLEICFYRPALGRASASSFSGQMCTYRETCIGAVQVVCVVLQGSPSGVVGRFRSSAW